MHSRVLRGEHHWYADASMRILWRVCEGLQALHKADSFLLTVSYFDALYSTDLACAAEAVVRRFIFT